MEQEKEEKQLVIVGLGNPGREYLLTRHNMGYLIVAKLAEDLGLIFREEKTFKALVTKGKKNQTTVHLLLPTTYMNESGQAVKLYLDYYKIPSGSLCVVCDDVHLAFGQMRLRTIGSDGGHNGLKSIYHRLHSHHYLRLRVGIGRTLHSGQTMADYVLELFTQEECAALPNIVEKGSREIQRLISEDISSVMNTLNVRQREVKSQENKQI